MMRLLTILTLILLPPGSTWCLVVRGDLSPHRSLADPAESPEVVSLLDGRAVGTLIAPEWILTAAHVGEAVSRDETGRRLNIGDVTTGVREVRLHPHWDASAVGQPGVVDLALIRLSRPVCAVSPARLYRDGDEQGQVVVLYGWGRTGDGVDPALVRDGRFRMGENTIDEAAGRLRFGFDRPGSGQARALEAVSGPGDSGGPAFIQTPDGPRLAGVSSFQEDVTEPGLYGVVENYERVSIHLPWIDAVTAGSADCGNSQPEGPAASNR